MAEKTEESFSLEETSWYRRESSNNCFQESNNERQDDSTQGKPPPSPIRSTTLRKRTTTSLNLGERTKTARRHSFEFLEKSDEKLEGGLVPKKTHWYYGYFIFSFISLIACIVTLWAEPPIGKIMYNVCYIYSPNCCYTVDLWYSLLSLFL